MARDVSPIVKQSRREGFALAPKAHKIMAKKSGIPGEHGDMRVRGGSLYLTQLREKQKVRRTYGLLEKQFAKLMKEAQKADGLTGENLLEFLERRADNVVFRAGFALTRRQARQLVSHGHFLLNGSKHNVPSTFVEAGDKIELKDKLKNSPLYASLAKASPAKVPSWIKVDRNAYTIEVLGAPQTGEIETL